VKLLRYGAPGQERPGVLGADGVIRDLSSLVRDLSGDALRPDSLARLRAANLSALPAVDGHPRLGPCVGHVGKFIAIGLNYSDHAAESGMAVPKEPIVFMKATSCIVGPADNLEIPRGSHKTDWEVELGIVISRRTSYLDAISDAHAAIAGYVVVNDVSGKNVPCAHMGPAAYIAPVLRRSLRKLGQSSRANGVPAINAVTLAARLRTLPTHGMVSASVRARLGAGARAAFSA
jgi:2-keto-4-pentenoate hydratase/2-oxohepta-3-ene-1,7-dioic acid hydratase in catechol pathway